MNKVYKLVWSKIRNCWIVVSEIAKSHSKSAQNNFVDKRMLDNKICLQLQSGIFNSAIAENNIGFVPDANIYNSAIVDRLVISDFKITVAAIVKNEAKNVSQWVKAARSCADEIVVVDTGSTDGTVERFADYGIKCYHYDWNDDFASAKNYMISLCHGDWIVLLDGDEWFRDGCDVRKAIAKHHNNPVEKAIIADWICLDTTRDNTIMFSGGAVRAFRNLPEIRYFRKVHENLTLSYENFVFEPDLKMYHTGYSGDVNRSKHERNLRIMRTMFDFDNGKVELPADWRYIQDTYAGLGELEKSLEASDKMLEFDIPELLASSWITRFNVLFQMKVSMERMEKEFDHCFKTVPSISGFRFLASIFYMVNDKPKKAMDEYCEGIRMLMGVQDRVALENSFWRMYLPKASALISSAFMQIGNVESALTACFVSEFYCGKNELTNIALADIYSVVNKKQRKSFNLSLDKVYPLLSCAKEGLFVAAAVSGVFISSFALPTNVLAACGTLGGENNTTSVCYSYEKDGSYYWVAPSCVSNNTVTVGGVTYTVTKHTPQNSAVVGGVFNNSSGTDTVVVGGGQNHATGIQASVLGGTYNDAVGTNGTVVGGEYNTAGSMTSSNGNGRSATVVGGSFGKATGSFSVQLGGSHSEAKGDYAISIGSAHSYATCSIAIMGTTGTSTCANTAKYSVAIGLGSLTTKNYEIAIGSNTAPITLGGNMTVTGTNTVTDGTTSKRWSDILQAGSYTLPTATSSVLGGVKTGSNITNSSGTISLTKTNVVSALGYTPPEQDTNTHYTSHIYVGSGTAANAATTNGNTKIALADDSTVRNTLTIKGTGKTTVTSDANGVITINSTDANTTYSNMGAATASAAGTAGLVPAPAAGKQNAFLRGDGTWVVPTDTNTHYTSHMYVGSGTAANAATTNGNTKIALVDDSTVRNTLTIKGTGSTSVTSDANGVITINSTDNNTTYSAMSADELNTGTATTSRAMTAKVVSDYVKSKTDDKITGLSVSGKVITYTKGDGTTGTITTQDNDTTYGAGTTALLNTGTDTTNKVWTSKALADYVKGESRITADGTFAKKANTAAANITALDTAAKNAIKSLSVSGKVITYTKGDGTTGTITTQDTNTTYNAFTGATASVAGTTGLVTAPAKGQQGYVLHGDGTWSADKDTTYSALSASELTTGTATTARSVTAKVLNDYVKSKTDDKITGLSVNGKVITYTKGDGTTGTITTQDTNTTYSAMGADELSTGTATTGRTVTAKVVSDYVKSKTDDKISNLSVNGNTITYTKGNGTTGSFNLQDTTYTTGNASVLNTGTETAGKLWSGKVLSDYVVGKVNTEANTRSTADTALDNRIGTLSSNGNYIKKSATNNMAANLTLLDYHLKATNDNITGFSADITRNKNNIATLNTSVSSALSSVGAASSVIDLLSNTKADASLANLNASGKRVIANAAINAVQEYMASQNGTVTPSAPMMYNNSNSNGLMVNDAGNGSLHVGEGSYVNGTSSIAIGVGNQVNANNAGAFGDPSIINADASYVLGNDDTVNTGAVGSFVVGNDSVSSAKGGLTFGSNNNLSEIAENSIALGNNITVNGKNSVALGSNSIAVDDNVVSVGNNTLQRKIVNVLAGDVSENSNEVVTGSQLFSTNERVKANEDAITQKADLDASNIDVDSWTAKLGVGTVEENNTGLINGGTVFNAIQQVKDNSLIQQNGDILSIGNTIGGSTIDVSNNLGDGRIITGVITDPDNPYSATNVGYVQSVSENIVNAVNNSFTKMNDKVNKLGANASALAALTPASFEGDEKWSLAASVGHYHGETGGAVGAFYKPTENVIMNIRMAGGNGENMAAAGVAVSLSKGDIPGVTKRQLASEVISLKQNQVRYEQKIAQQDEVIKDLVRRLEAVENK